MTNSVFTHTLPARRMRLSAMAAALALACAFPAERSARAAISASGDILPSVADPDFPGVFILNFNPVTGVSAAPEVVIGGTGQAINGTDIGTLFIDAPAFTPDFTSDSGIIGDEPQGAGFVTIAQAGSRWAIDDELIVGNEGQGSLDLVNGGALTDTNLTTTLPDLEVTIGETSTGQGLVTVRNAGSLLRSGTLIVGDNGTGVMELTLGGQVETMTNAIIGDSTQTGDLGSGLVNVDGASSRWLVGRINPTTGSGSTGNLVVGQFGRGTLNITNRGVVRVTNGTSTGGNVVIGAEVNSLGEVIVDGVFSQLRAFGTITVGANGNNARGVLRVRNGGEVRATGAMNIGVDGVLEVSGGVVLAGNLATGISNSGTIQTAVGAVGQIDSVIVNNASGEIRNAGTADRVRERLIFTRAVTNSLGGLITSIGGEMEFTANVINNGLIAGRDAIYRFRDPFTNAGSFDFSVGDSDVFGQITNNGSLGVATDTSVTFYDPVINNNNLTVLPGGAAIFLDGLTLNASSVVSLQLNAVASVEEIGELQVFGTTFLDGALDIRAFGGLNPQPGDSYQIISGSNITGTFDTVSFPPAPGNNWMIDYNPNSVIINFISAPAFSADFNGDNVVNAADLAIWKMNVGTGTMMNQGDADGDGDVDGNDFLIWQSTLGPVPPIVSALAAVPEPGSMALAASALAMVAACRRKRGARAAAH